MLQPPFLRSFRPIAVCPDFPFIAASAATPPFPLSQKRGGHIGFSGISENVLIGFPLLLGKFVFVDFQTRCIATVGAAISRPKTFRFLSVSDKRKHFR